jgi:hypothetical protein
MGRWCQVKELTSTPSLFYLSPSFFIVLSIYILSHLVLIHSCIEVVEVCLSCSSVGLHDLLRGCMPVDDLRGGGVSEVGGNTLGRKVMLGSSDNWVTARRGR